MIGQVAIFGEAVPHHVVRRLVAVDAVRDPWEVDGHRQAAVNNQDRSREDQARLERRDHVRRRYHVDLTGHAGILLVRNERSAPSTPRR